VLDTKSPKYLEMAQRHISLSATDWTWIFVRWDDGCCWRCVSVLEHDVCSGVAHRVVQRPGVLPRWWARGALRLAAQPRVIGTHHVTRVRRLLYRGLWRYLGAGGDAEEDRQQWPVHHPRHYQCSFCVGLPLILFANTHTLTFLFKQERMVVRVWWLTMYDEISSGMCGTCSPMVRPYKSWHISKSAWYWWLQCSGETTRLK
jgi:hypothetical protein